MDQYQNLAHRVMRHGEDMPNRTGVDARSLFGERMVFDLQQGFPLVTLKKTFWRGAFVEMLWMLRGGSNIDWLHRHRVYIWDEWADEKGSLGPVYGVQWRSFNGKGVDQLTELLHGLERDPHSRRHIMSAWNPVDLPIGSVSPQKNASWDRMALAPCHCLVQFHVDGRNRLSAQVYQRSADVFLGVPFNIAGYALLVHLIAYHLGFEVGKLIWVGGDCHVYGNHFEQTVEMLMRQPRGLSKLHLLHEPETPLWEIEPNDLRITGYDPHPHLAGEVAV